MLKKLINMVGSVFILLVLLGVVVLGFSFICGVLVIGIKIAIFLLLFGVCTSIVRRILNKFRYR